MVTGAPSDPRREPVDWADHYARTRARVLEIVRGLASDDAARAVPACPAWTVHDVLAHLSGLAWALANGTLPGADVQQWIDGLVDARRGATLADLTGEWQATGPAIDDYLRGRGDGGGQLVLDAVAHEHDICHALGRRGDRTSPSVRAALVPMSTLLARDLAAASAGAIELRCDELRWIVGDGPVVASLEASAFELLRVFGSRRSERQLRTLSWQGDLDAIFPALQHFPLPLADIEE